MDYKNKICHSETQVMHISFIPIALLGLDHPHSPLATVLTIVPWSQNMQLSLFSMVIKDSSVQINVSFKKIFLRALIWMSTVSYIFLSLTSFRLSKLLINIQSILVTLQSSAAKMQPSPIGQELHQLLCSHPKETEWILLPQDNTRCFSTMVLIYIIQTSFSSCRLNSVLPDTSSVLNLSSFS